MKPSLFITAASILVFTGTLNAQTKTFELTGLWKNETKQHEYHFKADSSMVFTQSGYQAFINSYTVDFTKSPAWLDMTMSVGDRQLVTPALLKIINENEIIIEQFPPGSEHPVEFSDNEYTQVKLVRQQ